MTFGEFRKQIHTIDTKELEDLSREIGARLKGIKNIEIQKDLRMLGDVLVDELQRRLRLPKPLAVLNLSDEELLKALSD